MASKKGYNLVFFIVALIAIPFISIDSVFSECSNPQIKNVFCPRAQNQMQDSFVPGTTFRCIGDECRKKGISFPQNKIKINNFNEFVEPDSDESIWNNSPEAKTCVIDALRFVPPAVRTKALIIEFIKECKNKAGVNPAEIKCEHVTKTLCDLFICCNMPKPEAICPPEIYNIKDIVRKSKKAINKDIKPEHREDGWED